ncbi:homoserine kinase [Varunaivibrio sulfuroxidans]|uniref:Homoserine kinase n=2 Tax=Varunaivibrio sulfuroxidans TaxID=1773489 RepID=A0A4R3JD81_9PROT|nr:homoserine kinase [Varunaivibrio sulfuroxidans]
MKTQIPLYPHPRIDRMAVYTEVSDTELNAFAGCYDFGEILACKGIAEGIENSNFQLITETGNYILTLYEKRVEPDDLPYFLNLLGHLSAKGIPCPVPLKRRDGKSLGTLCGRPAAVVTFLAGMWPRRILVEHCAEVGAGMAQLHLAGQDFPMRRANRLTIDAWEGVLASCRGRGDEVRAGLTEELARELAYLQAHWPKELPGGVIHGDLFPDNVFFRHGRLSGIIDFYFACNDFFAYDVGICLNAWCFEADNSFNITKARRMLSAYRRHRDFSERELAALPLMARGAAMRFLLTRLYDWLNTPQDAFVTPKNPLEYLAKLRFHQEVSHPSDYGLE